MEQADLDGFDVTGRLADFGVLPATVFISVGDGTSQRRRIAASPALK